MGGRSVTVLVILLYNHITGIGGYDTWFYIAWHGENTIMLVVHLCIIMDAVLLL